MSGAKIQVYTKNGTPAIPAPLPIVSGGTGQTTQTAAFDALAPTTTKGDIIVNNGTDNIRLAAGTNEESLVADSAAASGLKYARRTHEIYEGGASVANQIARLNFFDFNVENPSTGNVDILQNHSGHAGGRLTLVSGNAVPTTDVTGSSAETLYYTPFTDNEICIANSSYLVDLHFSELSLSLSGLNTSQPYDIFLNNTDNTASGLELVALAWSSNTARATNIARTSGGGYWRRATGSGAAQTRYLGTIKLQASGQCEDSKLRRFVFNANNRVARDFYVFDTTNSYSYTTATWRASNGSTALRAEFVIGLSEEPVYCNHQFAISGGSGFAGICLDNTTQNDCRTKQGFLFPIMGSSVYDQPVAIGYHFLQMVEKGGASATFYGDNNTPNDLQMGMTGHIYA